MYDDESPDLAMVTELSGEIFRLHSLLFLEELMLAAPAISKKRSASVKILKMLHAWTLNPSVPLALGMVISVVILNAINVLVAQAQAASFSL